MTHKHLISLSLVGALMASSGFLALAQTKDVVRPSIQAAPIRNAEKLRQLAPVLKQQPGREDTKEILEKRRTLIQEKKTDVRDAAMEKKDVMREATDVRRDAAREVMEAKRVQVRDSLIEKKEAFRADAQERRADFKERLETKRATVKDRIEEKRTVLRDRLAQIQDERKKQTVDRLDQRLDALNDRFMRHLNKVLERLENLLGKIASRADKAEENGHDTSAARVAVERAKAAIADARVAVEVQAGKTYTINVTDEASLGQAVSAARRAMQDDLKAVKEAVRAAHQAVIAALQTLKNIPNVNAEPEETSTTNNENQ